MGPASRHHIMAAAPKTIRIFISSPGDVAEEREKARLVIDRLQPRYAGRLRLQPILWENLGLSVDAPFQHGIERILSDSDGVDIAVFILWSRIGSPLGKRILKADNTEYRSGTEREFDLMLAACQSSADGRPKILAYIRQDDQRFKAALLDKSPDEIEEMIRQRKLADQFIREQFYDPETGTNIRAFHTFPEPATFAERLKAHLISILDSVAVHDGLSVGTWEGSPYRGLRVFDIAHSAIFFGREEEVCTVLERLRKRAADGCAFALIVGASGSGKSSLARAGVLPHLLYDNFDSSVALWRHAILTPGQSAPDLVGQLARTLFDLLPELRASAGLEDIIGALADPQAARLLRPYLKTAFAAADQAKGSIRLILLIDQLEELFTHPALTETTVESFLAALHALATSGRIWVLATVRSDFYTRCQTYPTLMAMKGPDGQIDLAAPGPANLHRIITGPALLAGLTFGKDDTGRSLDQILESDAARHPEALPLLEYTLRELYEGRTRQNELTVAHYQALGGIEGALSKRAQAVYLSLPQHARDQLPQVLNALTTVYEGEQLSFVRRRAALDELTRNDSRRLLVETLIQERLLVSDEGRVYVAHEALLRRWERALAWAQENAELLRTRKRVEDSLARWEADNHDPACLLPEGKPLADAQNLASRWHDHLTPDLVTYIRASATHHETRRKKRLRIYQIATGILLFLAILAGIATTVAFSLATVAREQTELAYLKAAEAREAQAESDRQRDNAERVRKETQLREARLTWLPRAQEATRQRRFPDNVLYAARALGFRGYGYEQLLADDQKRFHELYPPLFDPVEHPDLARDLRDVIDGPVKPLLPLWSSPAAAHQASPVIAVAFSPDGRTLATGSHGNTLNLWDVATGQVKAALEGHSGSVNAVDFSPDGRFLASGSEDNTLKLWDVATGQIKATLRAHTDSISAVAFGPDGRTLASASSDDTVKLWDVATGRVTATLNAYSGSVSAVAFSPDGRTIASGSWDNTIRLWDVTTARATGTLSGHSASVSTVAFSPDGRTLASGSWDNTIKVWDVATGQVKATLNGHDSSVRAIAFTPDGWTLASGSSDDTLKLWDVAAGQVKATLTAHASSVNALAFSPDGRTLASGSTDNTVKLWDVAPGRVNATLAGHTGSVSTVAFAPDGSTLASGSKDRTLKLWDVATGRVKATLNGHDRSIYAVVFSPDGKTLASGSSDDTVKLWDAATGRVKSTLAAHGSSVSAVAFSPDGKTLASGSIDNTIKLWDVAAGRVTATLSGHTRAVSAVVFSPDGRTLASGSWDRTLKLWDAATGQAKATLSGHSRSVCALAFSPDGGTLASGAEDRTLRLWHVATGRAKATLSGHTRAVSSLAFSPDGRTLVSGSWDKTLKLWDVATGQVKATLSGHTHWVSAVAFSPDGNTLASGAEDNTVALWTIPGRVDLMRYLATDVCNFEPVTGTLTPATAPSQPRHDGAHPYTNIQTYLHMFVLQSPEPPATRNRRLFNHYLQTRAWRAAVLLLNEPMDEPVDARYALLQAAHQCQSIGLHALAKDYLARSAQSATSLPRP